jgi:hypothetical protein
MNNDLKKINCIVAAIVFHFATCALLNFLFNKFGFGILLTAGNETLVQWDVKWYLDIKEYGYIYVSGEQNSTAFFPLFPLVWTILNLSVLGISIVNLLVFYASYFFLAKHLKFSFEKAIFWLSLPLFFYCYIPYSESFFFFASTLLFIGLDKNNKMLIVSGIIIAALTRSVGLIFIPSFLLYFIISEREITLKKLTWIALYISTIIFITLTVFYFQYLNTGEWLTFFETQKSWRRELQLPKLPFDSPSGPFVFLLDVSALSVVLGAALYVLKMLYLRFFKNYDSKTPVGPGFIFAICYLFLIGLVSVLFSGVWHRNTGSWLMSLSRFVFVCPLFIGAISGIGKDEILHRSRLIIGSAIISASFLLYGTGWKGIDIQNDLIQRVTRLLSQTIYLGLFFFIDNKHLLYLIYFINCALQIFLFHAFLKGDWIA